MQVTTAPLTLILKMADVSSLLQDMQTCTGDVCFTLSQPRTKQLNDIGRCADPHAGNLLRMPGNRLAYIDFGYALKRLLSSAFA